ncbi:hypothetical protein FRC07_013675, partial [Ceratobasidium sp. 392]
MLYAEALSMLEEPEFQLQVRSLINHLNGLVFPRIHLRPVHAPNNRGPGTRELALARARELAEAQG